jgi:hypothetical protein
MEEHIQQWKNLKAGDDETKCITRGTRRREGDRERESERTMILAR